MRVESTRVINLEKFTDDTAIDPIYLERPYYLAPDGPVAREAFAVIREGMKGKAGIGKVALYGREYLGEGAAAREGSDHSTRCGTPNEIRSMDAIDELADMPATVKPDEVQAGRAGDGHVRGRPSICRIPRRLPGRPARDHRREDRRAARSSTPEVEAPPKVVNLMEALRKSLDTISASKRKAAPPLERERRTEETRPGLVGSGFGFGIRDLLRGLWFSALRGRAVAVVTAVIDS